MVHTLVFSGKPQLLDTPENGTFHGRWNRRNKNRGTWSNSH
jgi:hypothetical protein